MINPKLSYSPSTGFTAFIPDVALRDINGNHLPNYVRSQTAEGAVLALYHRMKHAMITVDSYPKNEEFSFCGNRFERVYEVCIDSTESA